MERVLSDGTVTDVDPDEFDFEDDVWGMWNEWAEPLRPRQVAPEMKMALSVLRANPRLLREKRWKT